MKWTVISGGAGLLSRIDERGVMKLRLAPLLAIEILAMHRLEIVQMTVHVLAGEQNGMPDIVFGVLFKFRDVLRACEFLTDDQESRGFDDAAGLLHAEVGVADMIEHVDHDDAIEEVAGKRAFLDGMIVYQHISPRVLFVEPAAAEFDVRFG